MIDFLKDLLVAEDHAAPYVWAAVALAHTMIGASLMIFVGVLSATFLDDVLVGLVLVASGYALWEIIQTIGGGSLLDGVTDWLFVMAGAVALAAIWQRRILWAAASVSLALAMIWSGVSRRVRGR